MTYISRKTRLLLPRWPDECDPDYLIRLQKKRSDGRLKRHNSCDDLRAWVADSYLNYQYLLELITDGEFQGKRFSGVMGRIIPVDALLDLLCYNGDNFYDNKDQGDRIGMLDSDRNYFNGSGMEGSQIRPDDILRVTNAAMSKLENISNIICSGSSNDFIKSCDTGSEKEPLRADSEDTEKKKREEYISEYKNTLKKISSLKQRMKAINRNREELNNKLESSYRVESVSSSGAAVSDLSNIKRQTYIECLQKMIEKLIKEKTQVLKEICQALNYINYLKKKFDPRKFSDSKIRNRNHRNCCLSRDKNISKGSKEENSFERMDIKRYRSSDHTWNISETSQCNDNEVIYFNHRNQELGSSEATFVSVSSLAESQKTYCLNNINLEQILKDYEQKLLDLACLEIQVEDLKKKAAVANYFKKRWLRCSSEVRANKRDEKNKSLELKKLFMENNDLRNVIKKLTERAEKDENEIEYLKYRKVEMDGMKEEIVNLRTKLKDYQLLFDDQREYIGRLGKTVNMQREKIENQKSHITNLCREMEYLRGHGKTIQKNAKRSRSYGSVCKRNGRKHVLAASSEEDIQRPSFCQCCGCSITDKGQIRPRSES